jgi:hypothetical protein
MPVALLTFLSEVVADVAENVLDLTAEEDHRDDDRDGNNGDDESVFDEALAFVILEECQHVFPSFPLEVVREACLRTRLGAMGSLS